VAAVAATSTAIARQSGHAALRSSAGSSVANTDGRPGAPRDLLGAAADPLGQRNDRDDGRNERPERSRIHQKVDAERDRHENEQPGGNHHRIDVNPA
jgi:hypothetical protein